MALFNFLAGLASVIGFASSFYFYFRQKKSDEVMRGFYQSIAAQSNSIHQELEAAQGIKNPEYFNVLATKVEALTQSLKRLNETIKIFEKTLWH